MAAASRLPSVHGRRNQCASARRTSGISACLARIGARSPSERITPKYTTDTITTADTTSSRLDYNVETRASEGSAYANLHVIPLPFAGLSQQDASARPLLPFCNQKLKKLSQGSTGRPPERWRLPRLAPQAPDERRRLDEIAGWLTWKSGITPRTQARSQAAHVDFRRTILSKATMGMVHATYIPKYGQAVPSARACQVKARDGGCPDAPAEYA
jgi:hypothetical protein